MLNFLFELKNCGCLYLNGEYGINLHCIRYGYKGHGDSDLVKNWKESSEYDIREFSLYKVMSYFSVLKGECCGVSFKYQIWVKSQIMFKTTCKFVFDGNSITFIFY